MQKNEINEERAVQDERMHTLVIEGRNAVLEAFRSGKPIDKVFVLDGCQDGPVRTIVREAKKHDTILNFVGKGSAESDFTDRTASGRDRLCSCIRLCDCGRYACIGQRTWGRSVSCTVG